MLKYESVIQSTFEDVRQTGHEFLARCKWHDDAGKPNLYINGDTGLYYCHRCGAKGKLGGENLVASKEHLRNRIRTLMAQEDREPYLPDGYLKQFESNFTGVPHSYWTEERQFSEDVLERFELGYSAMDDAVTIPVREHTGELLGVIKRFLSAANSPKYKYPSSVSMSRRLWGAWEITDERKVAVVEGPLDAVACWDARIPALAIQGAVISEEQASLLHKIGIVHIVIMTDNDKAGREAVTQIVGRVNAIQISVGAYRPYWNAKDPGELTVQQRRKMFHSAKSWHQWNQIIH